MQKNTVRAFFTRLFIFVFPFALSTSLILLYGAYLGEVLPLSQIIALQKANPDYIYYPSGERGGFLDYKFYTTVERNPDVLFLGSSRLQFARPSIVTNESFSVYNASVVGMRLSESYDFVRRLADYNALPELLILNLDFPDFNANRIAFRQGRAYIDELNLYADMQRLRFSSSLTLQRFFSSPSEALGFSQMRYIEQGYIGLGIETIQLGTGYRSDGSFFRLYGEGRGGLDANLRWVADGRESFEFGQELDTNAIDTLNALLDFTREHDVFVIAVLPPYHPEVYAAMDFSEAYQYIPTAQAAILESFDSHDYLIFDYTNPDSLTIDSLDFFDGWHLAETGNLRMWMTMLEAEPEILGQYADMQVLEALLAESSRFYLPR